MDTELAELLVRGMGQRVPSKLIDFGKALADAYGWDNDTWAYFLEKPWKWSSEYAAWASADYPQEGDLEFDDFVAAIE